MKTALSRRGFLSNVVAAGLDFSPSPDWANVASEKPPANKVHLNQVGYLPEEPKRAVVSAAKSIANQVFQVIEEPTGALRFSGKLTAANHAGPIAHEREWSADFSGLRRGGRYRVRLADGVLSPAFTIGSRVYADLFPLMQRFFAVQQCGVQTSPHRKPCHLDDGIIRGGPRDGQPFDAAGGWHDAGDYLKFVETTSYAVALMLFACDLQPQLAAPPTGAAALSPLLLQAKVGMDWLLKMHPTPQEFYYQVGDKSDHDRWRLPETDNRTSHETWRPRPVFFGIGANLAGRCAAAFAMASRLYRPCAPQFADRCLAAAQSVYALGRKHPRPLTTQPHSFYAEESWDDDMEWGAAELFKVTRKPAYLKQALAFADEVDVAGEQVSVFTTNALAHFALYPHASGEARENLLGYLRSDADRMRRQVSGAYGLATPYVWGTAEAATGVALTCLLYARLSGDRAAADVARRQRDYVLGCNPFGLSCLIGAGTRFAKSPHHQVAALGKVQIDGGFIGGPTSLEILKRQDFDSRNLETSPSVRRNASLAPAQVGVYQDSAGDFITNETAIDYTAQFLLLAAFYLPT